MRELKQLFKLILEGIIILPLMICGFMAALFLFVAYYKYLAGPGVDYLMSIAPTEADYENVSLLQCFLNFGFGSILLVLGIALNWPIILVARWFNYRPIIVSIR
jgi:hypothetical protein